MSSFAGEKLFASGPHRFEVGGLSLRHVLAEPPGSRGVQLSSQGLHGRAIHQSGELLADTPAAIQKLLEAIEVRLDGLPHELIDDIGRSWRGVVMLSFAPESMTRLGSRRRVAYRIEYLQVFP